ncbi:MAG: ferrous iron transport protein B [Ignavibacteria bacterium GWF2_33_9]|nr:MAG: ferrous iron transport protein B [Ignavibacteria bacterium GWF2_33_9]
MKFLNTQIPQNIEPSKKIALVGLTNSGKSSIYRFLTDFQGKPYYDSTFELTSHSAIIENNLCDVIDLPGIQSLNSTKPSEKITIEFLLNEKIDILINVIDSTMLSRGLKFTLELLDLGIPTILVITFNDEAKKRGIRVDLNLLSKILNISVISMNGRMGSGIADLSKTINENLQRPFSPTQFEFTHHIETEIQKLQNLIQDENSQLNGNKRFKSLQLINNNKYFIYLRNSQINELIDNISKKILEEHHKSLFETISYERHHIAMQITEEVAPLTQKNKIQLPDKIDAVISHPRFGYVVLIAVMFLIFFLIFYIGNFLSGIIEPPIQQLNRLFDVYKTTSPFLWNTINGAFMGIIGAVGIVLPYFLPLVFLNSLLEETGYMSRIVLLIDNLMHKIGLHGKSITPFIMGLGCSVPAIYSTRMLENKRDRIITAILIPFIPCSARLTVIFALATAFVGPIWVIIIFAYLMIIIALGSIGLSKILPESTGLIMEILPLKLPSLKMSILRTYSKLNEFLKEAFLFLILGGIVLGWIEFFNITYYIDLFFSPIIKTILDLPQELGSTLVFGFFRKELILVMANQALGVNEIKDLPLTSSQIIQFIIFVSLYFPCLSTFIVLLKEYKWKITIFSSVVSVIVALLSAILFRLIFSI